MRDQRQAGLTAAAAGALLGLLGGHAAWAQSQAVMLPSDLGGTVIDVSSYPLEHQRTYRELFVTKCAFCHSTARAINAAFLEVQPGRLARYGASDPPAESRDGLLVSPTIWRDYVNRMWRRPPCCNRCPVFTRDEAVRLWHFLVYDSLVRKTGPNAAAWTRHRRELLKRYAQRNGGTDDHARVPADPHLLGRIAAVGPRRDSGGSGSADQRP